MTQQPDLAISIADITILGRCRKMKAWFVENGLEAEFRELLKGGTIAAAKLKATGDPRADQVIRARLNREAAADG
jgi:arsenate reductase-like glutaredoxin family protein